MPYADRSQQMPHLAHSGAVLVFRHRFPLMKTPSTAVDQREEKWVKSGIVGPTVRYGGE